MKLLLLSDIQATSKNPIARKDDILQAFFKKFNYIAKYSTRHNIPILQAGDFFDRPRDWYLLFKLMTRLQKWKAEIYCIYGQHDMYLYSNKTTTPTSLGVLAKAGLVNILGSKPKVFSKEVYVYGCSINDKIPEPKGYTNILVIHAPISDEPLFPGHHYKDINTFARDHKHYDLILAGDIHRQFIFISKTRNYITTVVNTGPLLRHEATEYNFKHVPAFFIYDTKTKNIKPYIIPHRKATEVLSSRHLKTKKHTNEILSEFINSLQEDTNVTPDIKANITQHLIQGNISKAVKKIIAEVMADE